MMNHNKARNYQLQTVSVRRTVRNRRAYAKLKRTYVYGYKTKVPAPFVRDSEHMGTPDVNGESEFSK